MPAEREALEDADVEPLAARYGDACAVGGLDEDGVAGDGYALTLDAGEFSYRDSFNQVLDERGIDGLISELNAKNAVR